MPQVETMMLMQAGPPTHDATPATHERSAFRRLACAIAAVGTTLAGFGVKYLYTFWSPGSIENQQDQSGEIPSEQRKRAASFMHLVPAPSADERTVPAASNADALLAAIELVTGVVNNTAIALPPVSQAVGRGSYRHHDNADRLLTRLPGRPNAVADYAASEKNTLWHTLAERADVRGRADPLLRVKKYAISGSDITTSNLGGILDSYLEESKIPLVIRQDIAFIIGAYPDESRPVDIVLKVLDATIKKLQQISAMTQSAQIASREYYPVFHALRFVWMFSEVLRDEFSEYELLKYTQKLRQERWQKRENNQASPPDPYHPDARSINDYLASRSATWRQHHLSWHDQVVMHNKDEARIFSIADIIGRKHLDFMKQSKLGLYIHFKFDDSGLRDEDLLKLLRTVENPRFFADFKAAPQYQPPDYYKVAAQRLFEKHLQQMPSTPLHFDRDVTIERLILLAGQRSDSDQSISRATRETIKELNRMTGVVPKYHVGEKILMAYACGFVAAGNPALYGELVKQDVLDSDYIYRYRDAQNNTRSDVVSLDEYLGRDAKNVTSDISKRDAVEMLWPQQFSAELITYLTSGEKMVKEFGLRLFTEMAVIPEWKILSEALPPLSVRLEILVHQIGNIYGITNCNLNDKIEFTYRRVAADMLGEVTQKKKFTVRQIVLGTERAWKLPNLMLYEQFISKIPNTVAGDKIDNYKSYVRSLQAVNAQEQLIAQLNDLRKNEEVRAAFIRYIEIIADSVDAGDKPWYQFEETPLLLIFPRRLPTTEEFAAGKRRSNPSDQRLANDWLREASIPIQVVSLINRQISRFDSYADMLQQLTQDTPGAVQIKAHFPVGYASGFDDLALAEIRSGSDQYERWINSHIENVDRIVKSAAETVAFTVIEGASRASFYAGELWALFRPAQGAVISLFSISVGKLLQALLVSTRPDEKRQLLKESLVTLMNELWERFIEQFSTKKSEQFANLQQEDIEEFGHDTSEWIVERYFLNTTVLWRR